MRFSINNTFIGFAAALSAAGIARADDCSDGPANQPLKSWGKSSNKGGGFCATPWAAGKVVTGIEVWATAWQITGIQLTYSDGTKPTLQGQTNGDRHDSISWNSEDTITKMNLAGNYAADGLGLVHVEVAGKTLDVRSDTGSFNGDTVTLATGIFLGASGEAPDFVRLWTPLFMGATSGQNATITAIDFDDSLDDVNKKQQGISSVTLSEVYILNNNPVGTPNANQSWLFAGSASKETSSSLSTAKTNTFGIGESIEVGGEIGLPFVAEGEVKSTTSVNYEYSTATTNMAGSSDVQAFNWNQGSTQTSDLIAPGTAMHCKATTLTGAYSGSYTSTVEFTVNGKLFTFKERGTFNSISWTEAFPSCQNVKLSDVPTGANTTSASSTTKRALGFTA